MLKSSSLFISFNLFCLECALQALGAVRKLEPGALELSIVFAPQPPRGRVPVPNMSKNLSRCVVKIRHYPKCGGESVGVLRFEVHFLCMSRFFEKGLLLETHAALLEALDSKRQLKTIRWCKWVHSKETWPDLATRLNCVRHLAVHQNFLIYTAS
jgi:hypothetical protein